jgi:SpoIID/LytB domain protein
MKPTYHRTYAARNRASAPRTNGIALAAVLGTLLCAAVPARAATLVIQGAGDGHRVGMSQEGAIGYAEHGYEYKAILAHYYAGTGIGTAPPHVRVRVLVHGRVRRVALEAYVRGVVAAEMGAGAPAAALQAQAVASRTYALTAHAGGTKFDVYSDTRSQVYRGRAGETPATNLAVAATAGQIVTYEGRPAITYFFASSGGRTESVQNAFPGSIPEPWLQGVPDPFDQGPLHSWSANMSFAAVASHLRGLLHGSFRGIEVLRRGYSPRILAANVLGSKGRTTISGDVLAARLGLYDTWAFFSVSNAHGVRSEPDHSGAPRTAPTLTPSPTPVSQGGGTTAGARSGSGGGTPAG